jgi:hypothetical protein
MVDNDFGLKDITKECKLQKMCGLWELNGERILRLVKAGLCPVEVCTDFGYCRHHSCESCQGGLKAAVTSPDKLLSKWGELGKTSDDVKKTPADPYCEHLHKFPNLLKGEASGKDVLGLCAAIGACHPKGRTKKTKAAPNVSRQ